MLAADVLDEEDVLAIRAIPFGEIQAVWSDMLDMDPSGKVARDLCRHDRYFLLTQALKRYDALHPWLYARCREVEANPDDYLDLWSREHYKDLADDTPMLTANRGWTTHGELVPGDMVFSPTGAQVLVLAVTQQYLDSECYRIRFSDGSSIVAGAGHLWSTRQKIKHRVANSNTRRLEFVEQIVSTADIAANPLARRDIGVSEPIEYPVAQLPIHPYVLGIWLGDGHSAAGVITGIDEEVFMRIEALGYRLAPRVRDERTVYGLVQELRKIGVLNAKSIPEAYLRASVNQRMELLRGLMDSDGHCNTRGTATFCNVKESLSRQVYDLAAGLGLQPHIRPYSFASVADKAVDGRYIYWQVSFQAHRDRNPFFLPRKAARAIPPSHYRGCRTVTSVKHVPSVPTRCIQVEGGKYVAGRELLPTHNSTIITFAGVIQEILKNPEITVGIFSFNKPTARKFLRQIKYELETNTFLKGLFPEILWSDPKKEAPRWSEDGGIVVKREGNPKEATVEGHGLVDGQPTGAHFLLRVYDDVVTLESVSSPEMVKKTTEAWSLSDNLGARGADGKARCQHVGTRYSFRDTYQDMLDMLAVTPRIYPATDNGLPDGEPVFLTAEVWAEKRRKQISSVLAAQMLQNPAAGNEATFKQEWLRFIDIRPATLNVYIMADPASSKKKGSDSTAIPVVGMDAGGNLWLLDGYCHKMGLSERYQAIRGLRKVWMAMPGVQRVAVGYERFGLTSDLEYFEMQMQRDKEVFEIQELAWPREGPGAKDDRIQRLEPNFRAGRFYMPAVVKTETAAQARLRASGQAFRIYSPVRRRDHNGNIYSLNKALLDQYLVHPFGKHDDMLDAVSRIYDMEPVPPVLVDERLLEPETYEDGI